MDLPAGTVTFLLTDIQGSTRLWEEHPHVMPGVLDRHDATVEDAVGSAGGVVVKARGEGDSVFAVFGRAADAVAAAIDVQQQLDSCEWPEGIVLKVRMAIHTGDAVERGGDFYGPTVNRAARLRSAGHGGQVLVSRVTADLARPMLPAGASLKDLGAHRLPDLGAPERIFQLVHPGLPDTFPPLRALGVRPNNLPVQTTTLVGRTAEIAGLCELVRTARLVTVTGPGGVGKTRIALQTAAELFDEHPGGVWFVPLAGVDDPALVGAAVAQELGATEEGAPSLAGAIAAKLGDDPALLVLDNFEQVVDASTFVSELLAGCPSIRIVVTSRETLRLSGEHVFGVEPMPPPDPDDPLDSEAGALFAERARAADPRFDVDAANASAVARICAALDGLPLAIELAAARIRLFGAAGLASRLDERLALLTAGARDLPERHRTLRATIAWSHDLLGDAERTLLRRLAIFHADADLDAIEAVCGDGLDAVDAVASLVDRSLVRRSEGPDGQPRFGMLAAVREFALEQLHGADEHDRVADVHADLFLGRTAMTTDDTAERYDRLASGIHDLRAALDRLLTTARTTDAMRFAESMTSFWSARGLLTEGRAWLSRALASGAGAPPGLRARCERGAGALAFEQGALDEAAAHYRTALDLAGADEPAFRARVLKNIGSTIHLQGDLTAAAAHYEEALELVRAGGRPADEAGLLHNLAVVEHHRGNLLEARDRYEEALPLLRRHGTVRDLVAALNNLGTACAGLGDLDGATARHSEALELSRALSSPRDTATCLNKLASAAVVRGNVSAASGFLEESTRIREEIGDRTGLAETLHDRAEVARLAGDAATARRLVDDSLALARSTGDRIVEAEALLIASQVARDEGRDADALEHSRASIDLCRRIGDERVASALVVAGDVRLRSGDVDGSREHAHEALDAAGRIADRRGRLDALRLAADVDLAAADLPAARSHIEDALALARDLRDHASVATLLDRVAVVERRAGSPERAASLSAAAAAARERLGLGIGASDREVLAEHLAGLRDELGATDLDAAAAAGRRLGPDEAIELAMRHSISSVASQADPRVEEVERIARIAEYRDDATGLHIVRVGTYAAELARRAGLDEATCTRVLHAAKMHDIGKIGIPDEILRKPGELTEAELATMREHPVIGGAMLGESRSGLLLLARSVALTHHERWDGQGYPHGLTGEEIPLEGRITAIADVFDALTSRRPYRSPIDLEQALDVVRTGAGRAFDPALVEAFEQAFREITAIRARLAS